MVNEEANFVSFSANEETLARVTDTEMIAVWDALLRLK
jgi:hypothetical protein